MNNRDEALQSIEAARSVLERLPEAACRLDISCYNKHSDIQFFRDSFDAACKAFPFVTPTRVPHGDSKEYDAEEFYVDGVRLFRLVKKEENEHG